jgi:DtxR family manganese transport transcriptional regulator
MVPSSNAPAPVLSVPDKESDDSDPARRFFRARQARASEVAEDYAELIDDLVRQHGVARATEIARRLGVSHVTAVKAVARLEREGLAKSEPYRGVTLTEPGAALATRVRARHRLVVDVLLALGVPEQDAEADAEGIEHHVSPSTLAAFERFLMRQGKEEESSFSEEKEAKRLF